MKIVIVGASGFIGQHLGAHLGRQGLDVLGLDIRCDSAAVSRFPIQCCDCSSDEIVFDPPVDAVFYLAQARCYRAVVGAFHDAPSFSGVFWWNWLPGAEALPAGHRRFSPQGKEAEEVMRRAFATGRDDAAE